MDRTELLEIFERDNEITLTEKETEIFFRETEPEKISALCVEYFMEWGDSLQCNIIYNFETETIERRIGVEPYPEDCIEVYSLYPRWTHELSLADLLNDDEISKFRWYIAGREFKEVVKSYSINDYECDAVRDIQKIKDFVDLLSEVGQVESFETRVYNLLEYWIER